MKSSEDSVGPLGKNQRIIVNAIANKTAPTPEMGYNLICHMGESFKQRFFNEKVPGCRSTSNLHTSISQGSLCSREGHTNK